MVEGKKSKKGQKVTWAVKVYTTDKFGAGTNSNVFITLSGSKKSSKKIHLDNAGDNFESGKVDTFDFKTPDLGNLKKIMIGHDNSTTSAGWHLAKVEVTNESTGKTKVFGCDRWLADDEDDKKCEREIKATGGDDDLEEGEEEDGDEGEEGEKRYWDGMSKPKQKHPKFAEKEDKRTVYWVDKQPDGPPTSFATTPRVDELAQHRTFKVKHRPTPSWPVQDGAKSYEATPRIIELAETKPLHSDYTPRQSELRPVSKAALSGVPPPRIEELAKSRAAERARARTVWDYDYIPQPVPETARKGEATPRVADLAESKKAHQDFEGERPIRWEVSEEARNAQASTRIHQLCRPRSRTLHRDNYDGFKVPVGALHAVATPRVTELSAPLPRKQRSKKIIAPAAM